MSKKIKKVTIITLLIIVTILILGTFYLSKKPKEDIPTLKIILNNTTLNEINDNSKEIKYKNNSIKIIDNKTKTKDNVTIKGRGNTTWNWAKKPYQIQFDEEVELFELGKSNKYILLANYVDETLLRTDIAFYIASKLNMQYAPKGTWVNLYIDGEYLGVYYITNKIEISNGSVDLKDDLGIIVELDNIYYYEDEYYITDTYKDHLVIKDVNNKAKKEEAISKFMDKYALLEKAVEEHNWNKIIEIIDIESLAKHHIVYELTWDADAYKSSFFMYMDGSDDKIHFGPVWDFDRSYDNNIREKVSNLSVKIPTEVKNGRYDKYSEMMFEIVNFPEFKNAMKKEWNKYMENGLEDILDRLTLKSELLEKDANRNIKTWNYKYTYKEYTNELLEKVKNAYNNFSVVMRNN